MSSKPTSSQNPSRRDFLKRGAAAAAVGLSAGAASRTMGFHAAGSDTLRVGLIGCGGRGTGAAAQALRADKNVKLTAMADVFGDRLETSLAGLKKQEEVAGKIDVPPDRRFTGMEGYKGLLGGRRAFVVYASGGEYAEGTEAAALDMQKPYLKLVLGFMGITKVREVTVAPTLQGGPDLARAKRDEAAAEAARMAKDF